MKFVIETDDATYETEYRHPYHHAEGKEWSAADTLSSLCQQLALAIFFELADGSAIATRTITRVYPADG